MLREIAPMPIMVKNYSKMFGVSVRIQGSTAYTNGKVITIPRLDVSNPIIARLAYGYLAHESAHIRYTDFSILQKEQIRNNLFLFSLFNILEDSRIEKLISQEFIGVYENLELLNGYYKDEWKSFCDSLGSISVLNVICAFIQCYSQCLCQRFKESRHKASILYFHLRKRISVKDLNKIASIVKECSRADDSESVYKNCLKIFRLIKSDSFSFKVDNKILNRQEDNDENFRNILDESKKIFNKSKVKISDAFLREFAGFRITSEDDDSRVTPSRNGAEIMQSVSNSQTSSSRDDFGVIDSPESSRGREDFIRYANNVYTLRSTLYRKMNAYVERMRNLSEQGRKIDILKAQKLPLGETAIFKSKSVEVDYSTCVQICVDVSSSMLTSDGGVNSRCEDACICALNLALALENLEGIKTAVHYFPAQCGENEIALDFDQRASKRAPYFDQKPRGSTPMAQCLYTALQKALLSNCSRKIVIIITDGMPDSVAHTKKVLDFMEENNVEVFAISIRSELVLKLFPKAVIVNNAKELNGVMNEFFDGIFDLKKVQYDY